MLVGASLVVSGDSDGDVDVDARGKVDVFCALSGNLGSASGRNIVLLPKALRCMFVGDTVMERCEIV